MQESRAEGGHARTMGTQRCPMATDRTDLATEAKLRWPGPPLAGHTSCAQRNPVGLGHRGTMAGAAQQVSAVPDLPPPFPAVGARGQTGTHLACLGGGVAGPRKTATGEGFHRLLLHGGKKRGPFRSGLPKRGKGTKIIGLADDHSLPVAVRIESASPHESQLVEGVLGHSFLDTLPARLIGDKAYDSDRLDRDLAERCGIEMIAPHRGARRKPTQDGRPLRRYRRRWRVERLFAWFSSARNSLGVPRSRTSSVWSAWVVCKSCSGMYERLLVPQRHHGIDRRRTACGNVAGQQRHGNQRDGN